MITELSIRNFAIIDDISVTFHDGITVLTGETGAGKSIIIDAVQLIAGERGSVEYVRHGADKAEITALFSIESDHRYIHSLSTKYDIEIDEGMLILERTITKQGKSICRVNHKLVTLTILREFGQQVVNIHSQHDTIQLMDRTTHLPLLDTYYKEKISTLKTSFIELYNSYIDVKRKLDNLNYSEQETAHRIDLLKFQINELEQANLQEKELERLTEERNHLQNFEKIYRVVNEAYFALYGDQKGLEWLDVAQASLQDGKELDPFIANQAETLTNTYYQIEDIHFALRDFADNLHFDETKLNEIESRLDELHRLSKKYGSTVSEMMDYQVKITKELEDIENKDSRMLEIENDMNKSKEAAMKVAMDLHRLRQEAAIELEAEIKTELADLYLENASFEVYFSPVKTNTLNKDGIDHLTFRLSTNLGEPLKDMNKVASGGELSRVMLALKKVFAKHDHISTVVFDEIDTGVSGRVAQAIAEKMYQISQSTQVLCITHLPQVAAMSDQHLLIKKEENQERTTTSINELTNKAKVSELGKMITGTKLTDTAMEHAEELLELTQSFKRSMYEDK